MEMFLLALLFVVVLLLAALAFGIITPAMITAAFATLAILPL